MSLRQNDYQKEFFFIACNNIKGLVLQIDKLKIISVHDINEKLVPITNLQK